VLSDFQNQSFVTGSNFYLQRIQNLGKFIFKLHINNGTNNLGDLTSAEGSSSTAVSTDAHCKIRVVVTKEKKKTWIR
jgi:hypothetical protein